ncbi:MAG: ribosome biogenesis GTP-binding protein YihA/YsxC [Peptococcaceae bacterium]
MIIKNAEFVISAVGPKQYPGDNLPEIALAGRSNVGKSSLINKFINRKNLARTSSKPGKTQTLNYYRINNDLFYFVDLPGYGFAQVSQSIKEKWSRFIDDYLTKRETLTGVIQLVDLRHPPSKDDIAMYDWLMHMHHDVLVVATKCDKISKGQWQKHVKQVREGLKADKSQQILVFSAETGQGLEELHQWVEAHITGEVIE